MVSACVIGAGPAGLMAADVLSRHGVAVSVYDAMPSVARKFLMAGKSGLNLTKNEETEAFIAQITPSDPRLRRAVAAFGPAEVIAWAEGLGQPMFTGSTGRVFPTVMKASPLLRAWLSRLVGQGVKIFPRHRWRGFAGHASQFETPMGAAEMTADLTILAMGGASWARLGSDGAWAQQFPGIVVPFAPANAGFRVAWSSYMAPHFGTPVKATALHAGGETSRGEWVITHAGVEGGGIYPLTPQLRAGAQLTVDLLPHLAQAEIDAALAKPRGKTTQTNHLRKVLRLDPVKLALVMEFGRSDIAASLKALHIPLNGPMPMDSAISTAGGLSWSALDDSFMLVSRPGTFAAGEMLDWEAPTGGYLLTGCLATGRAAAHGALQFANLLPPTIAGSH